MGIKDLLRFMKPYIEPIHIKEYAGKRIGIDAYSWLHKGAYSCSMELCLDLEGDKKLRYLQYFVHRIKLLRYYKIVPVVVFDGGNLPCKSATEEERKRKRKTNLDLAMTKYKEGSINDAAVLFQRAVSITPSMANKIIQILRSENVEFVVAPYEADAQLAFLSSIDEKEGGVAAVITEDSDLLAYGCKAIIFKMDRDGNGEQIILDSIFDSTIQKPSFRNMNKELFTGMCVLAGCDFLHSVPGIGIVKAHSLVSKYRNIERVLAVLKIEKGNQMPEEYVESFREALAVFEHAQIYDAKMKMLRHMKPIPEKLLKDLNGNIDFLGPELPHSIIVGIAEGRLNPFTMKAFEDIRMMNHHSHYKISCRSSPRKRVRPPLIARKEVSCFEVPSARETLTFNETDMTKRPVMKEWNHLTEAASLAKLAFHTETKLTAENILFPDEYLSLKLLDNNPFKKRAASKALAPPEVQSYTEQYSEVTVVENEDVVCLTRDSQESMASWALENLVEDEHGGMVSCALDMQENTGCKDVKIFDVTQRTRKAKKLKKDCSKTTTGSKNASILNFFSRTS